MSTLEQAIAIAAEAHAGQVDKGGAPYILHPLRVMLAVKGADERISAVLHDVCEDCPAWSLTGLRNRGFSAAIIDALDALTRRDGESYMTFIRRAAANPIARAVKLADLRDNSDLSRIPSPTPQDHRRLMKYHHAADLIAELDEKSNAPTAEGAFA